jgi:tellurite methyltransferase
VSQDDRDRWNARWAERALDRSAVLEPSAWLLSLDAALPRRGRALDVAGGTGRHAVWLARRGLDVTLIDISDHGLAMAAGAARDAGVSIHAIEMDLENAPLPAGPWDLVVIVHYLQRSLFPAIAAALAPGGLLLFCHQTRRNLERHAQPGPRFLLDEGEAVALVTGAGLELVSFAEDWQDEGRHEARVIARRAPV